MGEGDDFFSHDDARFMHSIGLGRWLDTLINNNNTPKVILAADNWREILEEDGGWVKSLLNLYWYTLIRNIQTKAWQQRMSR